MSDDIYDWLMIAGLLPSLRDIYVSGQHLALTPEQMIKGLWSGKIVLEFRDGWRAVYA